jgi:hypothetical protein
MPRGKKGGSISKRVDRDKDGKIVRTFYEVRQRYTDLEGRQRDKKRRTDTQADALEVARQIKNEIAAELASGMPKAPNIKRPGLSLAARIQHLQDAFDGIIEALLREQARLKKRGDGGVKRSSGRPSEWPPARRARFFLLYRRREADVKDARQIGQPGTSMPPRIAEMLSLKMSDSDIALQWAAEEFEVPVTDYLPKILAKARRDLNPTKSQFRTK